MVLVQVRWVLGQGKKGRDKMETGGYMQLETMIEHTIFKKIVQITDITLK